MKPKAFYVGVLLLLGAGWGLTQPLTKIAVSEGYKHFGLIFWQLAIGATLMAILTLLRGRTLSLRPEHLKVYAVIALIGTMLPNTASYQAAVHLPSGVLSILLSLVPMLAFPIALSLGLERFRWGRLLGLAFGFAGVALLVLPETSLPDRTMVGWIPVAIIASLFYAFEGNYVARWGTEGLDALQVLFGASLLGAIVMLPVALLSGQWIDPRLPWGAPDVALILASIIHVIVYAGYVWLVGAAGAVFSAQIGYFVTGFGLIWAMAILDEAYSPYIWASVALILAGLALVQPRGKAALAAPEPMGQDTRGE